VAVICVHGPDGMLARLRGLEPEGIVFSVHRCNLLSYVLLGFRLVNRQNERGIALNGQPMGYRKLRIAWSVACGIVCLLLILLWVRSYWWWIECYVPDPLRAKANAVYGLLTADIGPASNTNNEWGLQTTSVDVLISRRTLSPNISHLYRFEFSKRWVCVPLWTLVVIPAAIGAAPWLPFLRWRFSLRTLLIGMTAFAAVLALVGWAVK
jgi:hypothetical protein